MRPESYCALVQDAGCWVLWCHSPGRGRTGVLRSSSPGRAGRWALRCHSPERDRAGFLPSYIQGAVGRGFPCPGRGGVGVLRVGVLGCWSPEHSEAGSSRATV